MILTRELIMKAATHPMGGWSKSQLLVLGIIGFEKGWLKRCVGMEISEEDYRRFFDAGNKLRTQNEKKMKATVAELFSSTCDVAKPALPDKAQRTPVNTSFNKVSKDTKSAFYSSDDWKDIRVLALRKGAYKCAYCGQTSKTSVLHVDHIIPLSVDWTRRLDLLNLQVLCADCNLGKRNYHCDTGPI